MAAGLRQLGQAGGSEHFFDTITVALGQTADTVIAEAEKRRINLRQLGGGRVGIALDETVTPADLADMLAIFNGGQAPGLELAVGEAAAIPEALRRTSDFLTHPIFNQHHSETEMLRYLKKLEARDLSLTTSMIPLGSCTMKLNAAAEMMPVSWREFSSLHPYAPADQAKGYAEMIADLSQKLCAITGYDDFSMQPNSGAQGEYAGLLTIASWQKARGEGQRNVCLIPVNAHGTNPASAHMVGWKVVAVKCDARDGGARIIDFPASFHNGACGFAFGDGHAEIKKWIDSRTIVPVSFDGSWWPRVQHVASPNNPDVAWIQDRASARRR